MVADRVSRRALLVAASAGLSRGASSVRLLVVTGDHEFHESFWDVFKNRMEWKMEQRAHEPADTCTVYDRPIAPDFDVVLLYDMPRNITEPQPKFSGSLRTRRGRGDPASCPGGAPAVEHV